MQLGAMFNAYPNSIGKDMAETAELLGSEALRGAFRSFYVLPTVFNTDIDGGFSVITYDLCPSLARAEDLKALREMGIDLTFDLILNHLSVLSPQFQDILKKGDRESAYRDFFIDWNRFWEGCGELTEEGYIRPRPDKFAGMSLRKDSLPILMARMPDGHEVPYWNTFYQKVMYPPVDEFDLMELCGGYHDTAKRLAERIEAQRVKGIRPKEMDFSGFEDRKDAAIALL